MRFFWLLLFFLNVSSFAFAQEKKLNHVYLFDIASSINPSTFDYLEKGFQKIQKPDALILIKLNTPGGLVSTTKKILTLMGQSPYPIALWVTPEGASATSAGAIIASGAHYLFMSPGTNIGASTPVSLNKEIQGDLRNKAVNDLVALTTSLAKARGHNPAPFKRMIETGASYQSQQAIKEKIIDSQLNNLSELPTKISQKVITLGGQKKTFLLSPQFTVHPVEMSLGLRLLNILANPSLAYILFILGAGLIYLELQAPGGFIAGGIGAVALIMAGIGFQVLPLNLGALALIVLAFVLFILEVYITSYGILSLGGLAALISGSLFLFRSDEGHVVLKKSLIFSTAGGVGCFLLFLLLFLLRDFRKKPDSIFQLQGEKATVINQLPSGLYQVKVAGEIWKAQSQESFQIGEQVLVLGKDAQHLKLQIKRIDPLT